MASARYTLNITPDPPEEPPHEMTAKEKRENFWFYYKWHVIVGAVVLLIAILFIKDMALRKDPDYTVGVLTQTGIPVTAQEALEEKLAQFFDDRNGDGEVTVSVQSYTIPLEGDTDDPYTVMAGMTQLTGDLQAYTSMIFLTNDAALFSRQYGFFVKNDGTLADISVETDESELGVAWVDCPALTSLALGTGEEAAGYSYDMDAFFADFRVVMRYVDESALEDEDVAAVYAGALAAYEAMTK